MLSGSWGPTINEKTNGGRQSRCSLLINSPPGGPAPSRTAAQISYSKQDLSRRFERWSKREQEGRGESLLIDNCGPGFYQADVSPCRIE